MQRLTRLDWIGGSNRQTSLARLPQRRERSGADRGGRRARWARDCLRAALCAFLGGSGLLQPSAAARAQLDAWPDLPDGRASVRLPELPSASIADAIHVHGELVIATDKGAFALGSTGGRTEPWRLLLGGTSVVQLAHARGRLWLAAESGLWSWDFARAPVRVPGVGQPVRAVAVDASNTLWAASPIGLFRLDPNGPLEAEDDDARKAFQPPARWQRSSALPERDVHALWASKPNRLPVALPDAQAGSLWAATPGALWRLRSSGVFERVAVGLEDGWWELRDVVVAGAGMYLVVPEGIWKVVRGISEGEAGEGPALERIPVGGGELAAALPSGAGDGLVLVLAGRAICFDPVGGQRKLLSIRAVRLRLRETVAPWLLQAHQLSRAQCRSGSGDLQRAPLLASALPSADQVDRLHRAVLRYLDLDPASFRAIDGRARWKGLWPEIRVSMGMDARRSREADRDQTFSSGAVRDLTDMLRERQRDTGAELQMIWRLGDVADPADRIAISRERRERIELREQVLERVDQVLFERVRLELRLASGAQDLEPAERLELELRIRELAASLDAWSGGEFSRGALAAVAAQRGVEAGR